MLVLGTETRTLEYGAEEVITASKEYFGGDELAASTFANKYALKHVVDGQVRFAELSPADMHDRIATEFARIEANYPNPRVFGEIRDALDGFKRIVPQGSPMYGIGNPFVNVSLSNCVVVASPHDSISSIIDIGKDLANLFKRRCGVGVDISTLRPDGSPVNNSALTTTGAWSFADFYSYVCRMIGQNGRRGALMITMDIRHPDIASFVTMKRDLTKVTGANVSVLITDEFMQAVERDDEWLCRWPIEADTKTAQVTKRLKAKELWRLINESAVMSAEPGLIFWDNYRNNLPAHNYPGFETISTNPCSELGLSAYDSCRLISVNLKGYVRNTFDQDAVFDFMGFESDVRLAMRLMDDLVDLEIESLSKIIDAVNEEDEKTLWGRLRDAAVRGRRTGLGTHGLADCLASLQIRYDSDEAMEAAERIYQRFRDTAYDESVNLAIERGPFPVFDWIKEKDCKFVARLPEALKSRIARHGRRNISLLTMAPTGSVSILSQTSSGIEPVFAYTYTRRKKINPSDHDARVDFVDDLGDKWAEFAVFHHSLNDYLRKKRPEVLESENPLEVLGELPNYFVTAGTIDPQRRVEIQGTIQKYIDHGISSTLNLPKGTTTEDGQRIYEAAWRHGLKGVTIYVEGSRSGVLVTESAKDVSIHETDAPRRPDELNCEIHQMTVSGQRWTFLVGMMNDRPYEIFGGSAERVLLSKSMAHGRIVKRKGTKNIYDLHISNGEDRLVISDIVETFANPNFAVMTRLVSMGLRHGVPIQYLVQQLTRDPSPDFTSFSRIAARVLKKYIRNGARSGEHCNECGAKLVFEDGCFICKQCGYTKCD